MGNHPRLRFSLLIFTVIPLLLVLEILADFASRQDSRPRPTLNIFFPFLSLLGRHLSIDIYRSYSSIVGIKNRRNKKKSRHI